MAKPNLKQDRSIRDRAEAVRAAASRHLPPPRLSVRETHLSGMEGKLANVLAWANALRAIGTSPNMLEPDSVLMIAHALDALAEGLRTDWQEAWSAHDPARPPATTSPASDDPSNIDLASLNALQLSNLWEEFAAMHGHWQAVRCFPFAELCGTGEPSPAGLLADAEAERASRIRSRIAEEAAARTPRDQHERDELLALRLREEMRSEGRIEDHALLSEAVAAWGQP